MGPGKGGRDLERWEAFGSRSGEDVDIYVADSGVLLDHLNLMGALLRLMRRFHHIRVKVSIKPDGNGHG